MAFGDLTSSGHDAGCQEVEPRQSDGVPARCLGGLARAELLIGSTRFAEELNQTVNKR